MLPIFFKRLNAIPIYHFMIGILFFALFFPNSNLSSFLYSQLGYIEFGTNLASSAFVRTKCLFSLLVYAPNPPKPWKWLFMELRLPAFFILIHLQHSIIFVLLSDSLYETIFSKFLYESGISKILEKYPLYDFFQYSG